MKTTSESFSWSRWCLLVAKHWAENRKRYVLSLVGFGGLLLVWFSFILTMDRLDPMNIIYQYMTYFCGLYITGTIYASTIFAELGSKRDGIGFLALPASQLEKLLCALLFGIVLFFVAYTVLFYAIDIPMVKLSNRMIGSVPRNWPNSAIRVPPNQVYDAFTGNYGPAIEKEFHLFLSGFFTVQSAFLLGSVYFPRYSFIKVLVGLAIGLLAVLAVQANLIHFLLPPGWHNSWLGWYSDESDRELQQFVALPDLAEKTVIHLIQWAPPVLLWLVTWFRIKEKQV